MRIQHNIAAMNSFRNYNNNIGALNKNLEKLSSGYKINRAGDDAAGLAISEKMRAQITGLETATKNVKDGISLVKTAEGALQEVHDMLNRMEELAVQSANGTYDDGVDRANLQKEVASLQAEIDRIADSSNFNGIKLMDGTQAKATATYSEGTASATAALTITLTAGTTGKDLIGGSIQIGNKIFQVARQSGTATAALVNGVLKVQESTTVSGIITVLQNNGKLSSAFKYTPVGSKTEKTFEVKFSAAAGTIKIKATDAGEISAADLPTFNINGGLSLQIGDSSDSYNKLRISMNDLHCSNLFLGQTVGVGTQEDASKAVNYIKHAINSVSSTRGDLGAAQNRLEHTQKNLSVMTENIQDAESTIRDTDVADEMMSYTKNNILLQSAQAMLAQANQVPQGVLQLLG